MERLLRDYFDKKIKHYDFRGDEESKDEVDTMIDDSIEEAMDILRSVEKKVDNILDGLENRGTPTNYDLHSSWMYDMERLDGRWGD